MRICGIKFGHDGSVAVVEDGRLAFSVELEKLDNQPRHCPLADVETVFRILARYDLERSDVDRFVVDGWHAHSRDRFRWGTREVHLPRAPYVQTPLGSDLLAPSGPGPSGDGFDYRSWPHYAGHVLGAYCSSPFAAAGESAFVLSWDGGMVPYLYYFDAARTRIENVGVLFGIVGDVYAEMAAGRGPFRANPTQWETLGTPGKIMAYVAYGRARPDLVRQLRLQFSRLPSVDDSTLGTIYPANLELLKIVRGDPAFAAAEGADVIASYHAFVQEELLRSLSALMRDAGARARNLCYAGGCALNIKWNQAIRGSGLFDRMWIPPFPNDAGSALGAACCAMVAEQRRIALDWSVYAGPALVPGDVPDGWRASECSLGALAKRMHESGEPVLFLDGNAELGPRALGNRSILAPAVDAAMKDTLNRVKQREDYRPVAPVCLEHAAGEVFEPGRPDPYMLYDHRVREHWVARVPAVLHHDGTARLQTVNADQHPKLHALLGEYHALSGVPLLCNTSANFRHKGFFPDVASAAEWGEIGAIWSGGLLYTREADQGG